MALELLAGPFPVTYGDTEEPINFSSPQLGYHESVGIIGNITAPESRGVIVQLDGIAFQRNTYGVPTWPQPNLRTGGLCCAYLVPVDGTSLFDVMDLRILRPVGSYTANANLGSAWCILPDRFIRAAAGVLHYYDSTAPAGSVAECTLEATSALAPGNARFSPGPLPGQIFAAFTSGRIYLYDFIAKELVGLVRTITENIGAWYSPRLGVFVAVHQEAGQDVVRIWADETRPTTVAAPTLSVAAKPGLVVTATTTVSGDDGDVCPGLNVAWTTTVGTVLDPVTETDEDGVATSRIRLDPFEAATEILVRASLLL